MADPSSEHVRFLRLIWVDVSGIRRCRCVPLHVWPRRDGGESWAVNLNHSSQARKRLWVHHTSRVALVCYFLPSYGDEALADGAWLQGDVILSPAMGPMSVAELPGSCDWVSTTVIHENRYLQTTKTRRKTELQRHSWCPRTLLSGALERLERVFGMTMQVGFETEFVLLDPETRRGLESSVYCQTSGFDVVADVLREMVRALHACGQTVLHVHGESAPGQFEIVTAHTDDVLGQADAFVIRKEVIQRVARKHGLLASFLPKIWTTAGGTGCHVHWSLKRRAASRGKMGGRVGEGTAEGERDGEDLLYGVVGRDVADFMVGVLENIDGLLLHTVGSPNSWRRVQPGCWAGAYACWGVQNKEALLRVIDAGANHVEFKAFDGTANPYLGLSALICAGMAGMATGGAGGGAQTNGEGEVRSESGLMQACRLPPPVGQDPQHLGNEKRLPTDSYEQLVKASLGRHIEEKLVRATDEGTMEHQWRESLRGHCSGDVDEAFQAFFEDFARVKMAEVERFKDMSFEDEVELLLDRY